MVEFKHQVLVSYQNELIPLPINLDSILLMTNHNQKLVDKLLQTYNNVNNITINQLVNAKETELRELGQLIFDNIYANYTQKM